MYVLNRPQGIHVSDSYAWVSIVEADSFGFFFHPHHVLYIPLAWRWTGLVSMVAPGVSVWGALSALSAVFGCAGIAALYATLRRLGASRRLGVLAGGSQAVLFGYWFFASEPEVYVISAACAMWTIYFLASFAVDGRLRLAAWAGVMAGLAALFHQTGIFLFAAAGVVFIRSRGKAPFVRASALFTGAFGAIVAPVYVASCWAAVGSIAPPVFLKWVFRFGSEGYGGITAASTARAFVGFARSIVGGQGLLDAARHSPFEMSAFFWIGGACGALGASALGYVVWIAIESYGRVKPVVRTVAFGALAAFAVYGLFSFYFDPGNFEWWTIPSSMLSLGVLVLVAEAPRRTAGALAAAALLIGAANFILDFHYRKTPDRDIVRNAARDIARMTSPDDVIVVPSFLGSVLWYENRTRTIFCPDKAVRTLGAAGARAQFARTVERAALRSGRVVFAGAESDGETGRWARHAIAQAGEKRTERSLSIDFFDGGRRFVRTVSRVALVAVDAEAIAAKERGPLAAAEEGPL